MVLYNKNNMEPLNIEKKIKQEWNEESDEYRALCKRYRDIIGFERGETVQDKDRYDKELLRLSARDIKQNMLDTVNIIEDVIRKCYAEKTGAFVEYGGHIINPAEFCAVKIIEPVVEFKKE